MGRIPLDPQPGCLSLMEARFSFRVRIWLVLLDCGCLATCSSSLCGLDSLMLSEILRLPSEPVIGSACPVPLSFFITNVAIVVGWL